MEKRLKCVMMLSLKEIALRRLAVLLSNDCKIPSRNLPLPFWESWINTNEDKVKYKISKLQLPESLREDMIDKVRPITLEIKKWTQTLNRLLGGYVKVGFAILYWTTVGTIDYKKTAEALLVCEMLDVERRYILASFYCLEDSIPLLWEELDEDRKDYFLDERRFISNLEFCWPRILKGELSDLDRLWRGSDRNLTSFNQWAFEDSAKRGNKTATEYFFRKLTHEEREASVMRTTQKVLSYLEGLRGFLFSGISCFLLSMMTPEQQMEIIKENPAKVMLCFYTMFWQDLLVENSGLIWHFFPTSDYGDLLESIYLIHCIYHYNLKSFREFFIMSPLDLKKYFVNWMSASSMTHASRFLDKFFAKKDPECIKCIFRNVDAADRVAIVFNPHVLHVFKNRKDGRRMVEVCLREAKLSKEDRERLKKERPLLRRVIEELYESDANADKEKKGLKRKL